MKRVSLCGPSFINITPFLSPMLYVNIKYTVRVHYCVYFHAYNNISCILYNNAPAIKFVYFFYFTCATNYIFYTEIHIHERAVPSWSVTMSRWWCGNSRIKFVRFVWFVFVYPRINCQLGYSGAPSDKRMKSACTESNQGPRVCYI